MFKNFNITKILIWISIIFAIAIQNTISAQSTYEYNDIWFGSFDWDDLISGDSEITLKNLVKFKKNGNYKIYIEDADWNWSYIQINVDGDWWNSSWWHWSANSNVSSSYNEALEITTSPVNPKTYEWVSLIAKTDKNYTGKIDFSKLQYRGSSSASWTDISRTGNIYISDYSDEWNEWYYNISPSDKGEIVLDDLIKFKKSGYYRLYVEDTNWNKRYQQLTVETWANEGTEDIEDLINSLLSWSANYEIYESRSCESYRIEFNSELSAYTSPNMRTTEYFINPDYFKRYIDSKNTPNAACYSGSRTRISSPYVDNYTGTDRIVAPNGKIYFINKTDWWFTSNQLKAWNKFSSFAELRQYINQFNPLTEMNL